MRASILQPRFGAAMFHLMLPFMLMACTVTEQVAVEVESVGHQTVPISGKRLWVDLNEHAVNLFLENQVATKIMHAIAAKGYAQASNLTEADYRLEFSYSFQSPPTSVPAGPAVLVGMGMTAAPRYTGHLTLRVFSLSNGSQPLWVGEASGSQPSADMQSLIDYLIAAAVNHLGQSMTRPASYTFSETDPVSEGVKPAGDE